MLRQNAVIRPRRTVPYPGVGSRFHLSRLVWEKTLEAIRKYGEQNSEGLVYWGGVIDGAGGTIVTSLLLLNHLPQGGRVRPTGEEMRTLLRTLKARDEKLVAQIHSHGGTAFHSLGDNQKATSYHPGFISIVVPYFGQGVKSLRDCAVYEFRDEFVGLTIEEIDERFAVSPQIVELLPWRLDADRSTLWSELRKKLKSIVLRRL